MSLEAMMSPVRPPVAPAGRSIVLRGTPQELSERYRDGALVLGSSVGVCGPLCGEITVRVSGPNSKNPGRAYASCCAGSEQGHRAFLWLSGEDGASAAKKLFEDSQKVPRTMQKGLLTKMATWLY